MPHNWVKVKHEDTPLPARKATGPVWKCQNCGKYVSEVNTGRPPEPNDLIPVSLKQDLRYVDKLTCEEYVLWRVQSS